jgi:hypothetical protein
LSGLGPTTAWKLIGNGTLETVRVGRRRLITYESALRVLTPAEDEAPQPSRSRRSRRSSPDMTT